ncbi:TPA: LysR family transcriptional regulator, partial [Salmonella enterica]|nr:LysR family transcriptional regulator [Salmonella enterica]
MNLFSSTKLKYFIAIMEEGSVSKACQKVNISRTPLSRAISDLELSLGFDLFTRSKSGMNPNSYGLKLYNRISPIYFELLKIENDIKKEINKNILRIAVTPEIPYSIVSHIKSKIRESNVDFDMHYIELHDDNHVSSQDFYDLIITEKNINTTLSATDAILFDIFMISSNNPAPGPTIFHELSEDEYYHFISEYIP